MMKISVSIDVPDLNAAETFYTQALGCQKSRNQGQDMVVLTAENCEIYLQEKASATTPFSSASQARDYGRHWTPVHLDFLCEDVAGVVAKVLAHGGAHEGGESGDWGSIAYCADPFGNGFCVICE